MNTSAAVCAKVTISHEAHVECFHAQCIILIQFYDSLNNFLNLISFLFHTEIVMEKIAVDILHISSPHKISVRLSDHREQYYHFRRELEVSCTESFLNGTLLSLPLETACPDQQCLVRLTSSWQRAVILQLEQVSNISIHSVPPEFLSKMFFLSLDFKESRTLKHRILGKGRLILDNVIHLIFSYLYKFFI